MHLETINNKGEKMEELGIYVHIPFCAKKCLYCDFISYENKAELIQDYIKAVNEEISNLSKEDTEKYNVSTIYIGGGTPSFIDSKHIVKILETIKNKFNILENVEITIELNPGTITKQKLQHYINCGINRISIGLQSTNNNILKQIGRIHTYEQFLENYNLAREVGFKNINVDLMLALPNQTIEILEDSIQKITKLNPEHISVYSLIIEDETPLHNLVQDKKLTLPDDETERKMYWTVKKQLEKNGYNHYEISNFAKQGYSSKHNTNCWEQKQYIGFGLAAHSYINNTRYSNTENIKQYITTIGGVYHVTRNAKSKEAEK